MSTDAQKTYLISGLEIHVDPPVSLDFTKPAVGLFILHGRFGNCKDGPTTAIRKGLLENGTRTGKNLYIITFDQRNHGHRTVDLSANYGWHEEKLSGGHNDRHAIDMYSIQLGTATDISFLIDFLPSYLFPSGEQRVETWGVSGVSLGGHATWLALTHEPRLTFGIPIIGCPDYMALISERAIKAEISLDDPLYFPDSLGPLIQRKDPVNTPYRSLEAINPFLGKNILVLSGADDPLVPWTASQTFVEHLHVGENGVKEVIVQAGAKHENTPEMVQNLVRFVDTYAL